MRCGFIGERGDVQPSETNMCPPLAVVVSQLVGAPRGRNVDLDHHKVRRIADVEPLDVLILQIDLVLRIQIGSQCRQAKRRK